MIYNDGSRDNFLERLKIRPTLIQPLAFVANAKLLVKLSFFTDKIGAAETIDKFLIPNICLKQVFQKFKLVINAIIVREY